MAEIGSGRDPRSSGGFTVHIADELEVYFNEVAHGRPIGFLGSLKWKPPTDVYETEDAVVVHVDIAGMRPGDFHIELADGILMIAGERLPPREGKRHYHAMEIQIGPFERRLRIPAPVDADSVHATYDSGFLEVRLRKLPARDSGTHSVKVE
jgi:HSP20 family protein